MGINVIGDHKKERTAERANWIARVWAYVYWNLGASWSEDQRTYYVKWGNEHYYCYEVDLYDHPEEIDIFCMGDPAQLSWYEDFSSFNDPRFAIWIHPTDKTVRTQLFPGSTYKDGETYHSPVTPIPIFDSDPDWDKSIVKHMYVEKFNVKTNTKLTNVKPWYTTAHPHNAIWHQENGRCNFCIFDKKRHTFIKSLDELRERATELNITHLYGDSDNQNLLFPVRLKKFAGTEKQEKRYYSYTTCEQAPPKISIFTNDGVISDLTSCVLNITVTEDTTTARKTGVKDFTYSIEKDGKTFIKKDVVESAPSGIYTAKLEIVDTPFTAYGDYKITVTARDNVLNTATDVHKMTLVVPPKRCDEWPGNPGLSNRVGVEHDDYKTLAHSITPDSAGEFFRTTAQEVNSKKWKDYTLDDATDVLRNAFYDKQDSVTKFSYFILHGKKDIHPVGIFGYNNLDAAKKLIDTFTARQERVITFGFCHNGAEEGKSDWINQPIPLGDIDENCPDGNDGVGSSFLKGKNKDLIESSTVTAPTIDSNNVANGIAEFKDSSKLH